MKVTIDVTAKDIARGIPQDAYRCPLALAARRVLGDRVEVTGQATLHLEDWEIGLVTNIPLPKEATRFVICVDAGSPVRPIQFTLDIPDLEPEDLP